MKPRRGDVFMAKMDAPVDDVIGGFRPVVVVSNNKGNKSSTICIVVPMRTTARRYFPTHVVVQASGDGVAMCENVTTISQHRLDRKVATLTEKEMQQIDAALAVAVGLENL